MRGVGLPVLLVWLCCCEIGRAQKRVVRVADVPRRTSILFAILAVPVFVVSLLAPSACLAQAECETDAVESTERGVAKAILGVWKLANEEFIDGKGTQWLEAARKFPPLEWDFSADALTIDKTTRLRYRIDLTQQPLAIDIAGLDRKNPEAFTPGIFKLEGDKLIICLCRFQNRERPKGYSPQLPAAHRYEFVR